MTASGFRWRYKVWESDGGQWSFLVESRAGAEWEWVRPDGLSVWGSREEAERSALEEIELDRTRVKDMEERARRAMLAEWTEVS